MASQNLTRRVYDPDKERERKKAYRLLHLDLVRARERAGNAKRRAKQAAYKAAYRLRNLEQVRLAEKKSRDAHKAARNERNMRFYSKNRERLLARIQTKRLLHPERRETLRQRKAKTRAKYRSVSTAYSAFKKAAKRRAAMPWGDREAIQAVYREAARRTKETGIQHDVDHVYPLLGRTVCGLHVETNLQILTHAENVLKGNKHPAEWAGAGVGDQ